jgi:hypothetical protein
MFGFNYSAPGDCIISHSAAIPIGVVLKTKQFIEKNVT